MTPLWVPRRGPPVPDPGAVLRNAGPAAQGYLPWLVADTELRQTVEGMALSLRRLLAAIDAGELTAPAATRQRLEGALTALEAVLRQPPSVGP